MIWALIRKLFMKGASLEDGIKAFTAANKGITKSDGQKLINIFQDVQKNTGKVIEFPKDRITPFYKPRPGEGVANTKQRIFQIDDELEKLAAGEGKYSKMNRNDREDLMIKLQDESSTLQDKTLFKDSPEAIAKIKADNKAAMERLRKKKMEERSLEDFTDDFTDDPEGLASGGLARVGMFGGGPIRLAKGAAWVINKLKEQLFDIDLGIGGSRFSKISSTQKDFYKKELNTLIKQLEQGGEIPKEMLDTMIADPKFKGMVKTRSTDKDLFELEGVLLDRQAGKQSDDLFYADRRKTSVWTEEYQKNLDKDVMKEYSFSKKEFNKLSEEAKENFRKQLDGNYASAMEDAGETVINDPRPIQSDDLFDAEGKLNKKAVLQEVKDSEEKMLLEKFDVKGRTKQASGGIAGQLHLNQGGRAKFANGLSAFEEGQSMFDRSGPSSFYDPKSKTMRYGNNGVEISEREFNSVTGSDFDPFASATFAGASTPVAEDKSLLSRGIEAAKGVGQDLLNYGSIPANFAAGITGLPIGYTTQDMRDTMDAAARANAETGHVGYADLGAKESYGNFLGMNPDMTSAERALALTSGDVDFKIDPATGKINYDPATLAYDFNQANPMSTGNKESGAITNFINQGGLMGQRVYTPMDSTFDPTMTQLESVGNTEQIARASQYGDSRMQAAADKGMDARMGRTYAENKQIMADPRMFQAKGGRASLSNGGLANILGV